MSQVDFRHLTVLVTGAGGVTGQGILQSLHAIKNRPRIIATDISSRAAGFFWADQSFVLPYSSQRKKYLDRIKEICRKYKVKVVFPGSDKEARLLAENSKQIKKVILATSSQKIWKVTGDKLLTNRLCKKLKIPTPKTYRLSLTNIQKLTKKTGYPFTIKQRSGSGSRGLKVVYEPASAKKLLSEANPRDYLLQEYLPPDQNEYTVGTYFDYHLRNYQNIVMIAYKRQLYHGNTIAAETVSPKIFKPSILALGKYLKLTGYINFQFIMKDKTPYLTDINARFSSSTSISLHLGYNWVETYLLNILYKVKPKKALYTPGIVIVRYFAYLPLPPKILQKIVNTCQ